MLHDLGVEFVPGSEAAAALAGQHFARYLERGGPAGRVVPDFSSARTLRSTATGCWLAIVAICVTTAAN